MHRRGFLAALSAAALGCGENHPESDPEDPVRITIRRGKLPAVPHRVGRRWGPEHSRGAAGGGGTEPPLPPQVWFIGDSGTQLSVEPNGLRFAAYNMVQSAHNGADFVGTRAHGAWTDNQHDGFPTGEIDDRSALVTATLGPGKPIEPQNLRLVIVDIITNNLRTGHGYNSITTLNALAALYEQIHALAPYAKIAVFDALPIDAAADPAGAANAVDFNSRIEAKWNAYDAAHYGAPLYRIRQSEVFPVHDPFYFVDQFHLNQAGHAKRTAKALPVLEPVLTHR